MRAAFTLIEMVVVIAVIVALMGMGYGGVRVAMAKARSGNTGNVVALVSGAIASAGARSLAVPQDPTQAQSPSILVPNWDINRDGLLDGDPSLDPLLPKSELKEFSALDRQRAARVGYRGLLFAAPNLALPKGHQDAAGRIIDSWGRPLRIGYQSGATAAYGGTWCGVWSTGPDGVDASADPDGGDDIRSWEAAQ